MIEKINWVCRAQDRGFRLVSEHALYLKQDSYPWNERPQGDLWWNIMAGDVHIIEFLTDTRLNPPSPEDVEIIKGLVLAKYGISP